MRNLKYYIACCIFSALAACSGVDEIDNVAPDKNNVIISATTGASVVTKSADTDPEQKVAWIDVFVFNDNDTKTIFHYERIDKTGNPDFGGGTFSIAKRRNEFGANQKYYVYLIANCKSTPEQLQGVTAAADLQRIIQEDVNLHLTGFTEDGNPVSENGVDAPELFLMDGVAYSGTSEPESPTAVVLYNGNNTENTTLSATIRRAAAKIVVNIKQGEDVEFHRTLQADDQSGNAGSAIYSFYQLPVATYILEPANRQYPVNDKVTTRDRGINDYSYIWSEANNEIKVIGYAYANDWNDTEMTKETSLILNIPMKWNKDNSADHSKESVHPNSWYKVPLSKENIFERNTCYIVNITINATGAENRSSAIDLQDIEYVTIPWIETEIKVGDNSNAPEFLMLNKDTVRIYNANFDATSLTFSSSSPITSITLENINGTENPYAAYYYNKYNEPKELSDAIKNTISATAEANVLNGGITINSPIVPATEAEINAQIAALGPRPEVSTMGMPLPETYVPESGTRPSNPSDGDTYTEYRYNNGTFQKRTWTYEWIWDQWDYDWSAGSWTTDTETANEYNADFEAWKAQNPNYQAVLDWDAKVAAIKAQANGASTHYNTIRYLEFKVTNQQGLTETFYVEQYPTIYITNATGWYSYRDDFKSTPNSSSHATTFHIRGDRISAISYDEGVYSMHQASRDGANTSGSFWYSKLSKSPEQSHTGSADWVRYYWASNESNSATTSTGTGSENTRMYHIRVTSTSGEYTVGRPKMVTITKNINYGGTNYSVTYETTDNSPANANLVSPSFMTASRLGVVTTSAIGYSSSSSNTEARNQEMYEIFSYHCANYVEVKQVVVNGETKKVVYDDWRLPTAAELGIIVGLQGASGSNNETTAIDYLLNAYYYFSASGPVYNKNQSTSGTSVRCVRDAFNEPTPIGLTE
ncbi:MAG: hypothetical protein IJO23_00360 [Bacteroidales bacterium]|nr:hypothetical protein [Bacteroidales bacterium]